MYRENICAGNLDQTENFAFTSVLLLNSTKISIIPVSKVLMSLEEQKWELKASNFQRLENKERHREKISEKQKTGLKPKGSFDYCFTVLLFLN